MDYRERRLSCGAARLSGEVELLKDFKENPEPTGLSERFLLLNRELPLAKEG